MVAHCPACGTQFVNNTGVMAHLRQTQACTDVLEARASEELRTSRGQTGELNFYW